MHTADGFVSYQLSLCNQDTENLLHHDESIIPQDTLVASQYIPPSNQKFNENLDYSNLLGKYACLGCNDTILIEAFGMPVHLIMLKRNELESYAFPVVAEGEIGQIGVYSPWRIQIVGIKILQNGDLEAHYSGSYSFEEEATLQYTYRKILSE